jgi:hypothetical protein
MPGLLFSSLVHKRAKIKKREDEKTFNLSILEGEKRKIKVHISNVRFNKQTV